MAGTTSSSGPRPPGAAPSRQQQQQQTATPYQNRLSSGPTKAASAGRARRAKHAPETPMKQLTGWLINNQSGLAANLLALLFLTHSLFPRLREHTTKFFSLSYYNAATQRYDLGRDDAYLVVFLVVLFSGLRAGAMEYVLAPYARSRGLCGSKATVRFTEQAWLVVVYTVFLPAGLALYATAPYYLSLRNLWTQWPSREMAGLLKAYILTQMAFWFQQIVVINIEDRRKDHWQMLTHHFITVTLIVSSYAYRQTPVAHVILVLMDVCDLFLPLAKCQKYLGYTNLCDVTFGAFMLAWLVCRQILFSMVCYSVWRHTPSIMPTGCFRGGAAASPGTFQPEAPDAVSPLAPAVARLLPFVSPATGNRLAYLVEPLAHADGAICYNQAVKWSFLALLLALLVIICAWFVMVVTVALRVVRGAGAEDVRSDEEEDDDEEESEEESERGTDAHQHRLAKGKEAEKTPPPPLEEEVGVDALDLKGWERRKAAASQGSNGNGMDGSTAARRVASSSTGVSLPGHHSSDRKELLGRIGCEKH